MIAPPNRLLWIIHRCRTVTRGQEAVVMIEDFLTRIIKVHISTAHLHSIKLPILRIYLPTCLIN